MMYIHINTARIKASQEEEFAIFGNTGNVHEAWETSKGFLGGYLLQSLEDPQVFLSCTLWETPGDYQAFSSSSEYQTALGGAVAMIESPPQGMIYAARAEYTP